jgi:hypothetical protein
MRLAWASLFLLVGCSIPPPPPRVIEIKEEKVILTDCPRAPGYRIIKPNPLEDYFMERKTHIPPRPLPPPAPPQSVYYRVNPQTLTIEPCQFKRAP